MITNDVESMSVHTLFAFTRPQARKLQKINLLLNFSNKIVKTKM